MLIKGELSNAPMQFSYSLRFELDTLEKDKEPKHECQESNMLPYILKTSFNKLFTLFIYDSTSNSYYIFVWYLSSTFFT